MMSRKAAFHPSDFSRAGDTFAIRSGRVVFANATRPACLVLQKGQIAEILPVASDCDVPVIDVGQLAILPGLIDPHVHFNDPGRTDWEGFQSGTLAAGAGGITTIVDMPLNSSPVTTTVVAIEAKVAAARGKLAVDVGLHGGLVPANAHAIAALIDAGVIGVKAFLCHSGIDDFPNVSRKHLAVAMPQLADAGVVLLAHAEIATPVPPMPNPRSYSDYLATRPPSFERDAIEMLIELCRETGCRTHIVHLADAGSVDRLQAARAAGLPITVETCPHYLTFTADEIADGQTQFKCAPPIRDAENRERLWQALRDGVIDFIASDHSPCPPAMKAFESGRFDHAWGGISSVQLGLSAVWTEASRRGFSLNDVARWMSQSPGNVFGIRSGIGVGNPASLVVFDPEATFRVNAAQLFHRHRVTPYDGRILRGIVYATLVRGKPAATGLGKIIVRSPFGLPS